MPDNKVLLYLGLGSNLGDRKANFEEALRLMDEALGCHYEALSDFIETEPWGFVSSDRFLNAAVRYRVTVPRGTSEPAYSHRILGICKNIERALGRTGGPEYGIDGKRIYRSRIIDIDILLIGDWRIDDEDLKIPHPLMNERDFVRIPLMQVLI